MLHMPYYSPEDFAELIEYAHLKNMCLTPGCTTCGCMPFRTLCRKTIGYENICGIARAMTPEYFAQHYTPEWGAVAYILDVTFHEEGGLPKDCSLLQELQKRSEQKNR